MCLACAQLSANFLKIAFFKKRVIEASAKVYVFVVEREEIGKK